MNGGLSLLISTLCFMFPTNSVKPRKRNEYTWDDMVENYYANFNDKQIWGTRFPYHMLADYDRDLSSVRAKKASAKYGCRNRNMSEEEFAKVCFALERDFLIRNGYAEQDRNLNKIKLKNIPRKKGKIQSWEWDEEKEE